MSRRWEWIAVTLMLLLAAVLRCWGLGDVPPGLSHDEIANGSIAQDILSGHHAIYFTAAYGHEPLYQYAQAATVGLFGDHWLGLRWPSVAFSLLGIAATYTLVRYLFDTKVAFLTIVGLSVSFWPLFYARVGLRAIALPFTAALAAYFFFRTLNEGSDSSTGWRPYPIFGGLFLGLSVYTYMAARFLPFILAGFVIYRLAIRGTSSVPWFRLAVLFIVAALVAAPLFVWLATHPNAEVRISEVREPLDRLLAGDPGLVWHNLIANLSFFTFTGDPWPHQGIPGRPVFADLVTAVLFVVGLLIAVWRWRHPRYGFLLVWLIGALVPSILSSHAPPDLVSDAPSSIRNILGLVVAFVFPALALVEVGGWIGQRLESRWSWVDASRVSSFAVLLLLPGLLFTWRDYFVRWPRREDVQYFYQKDLTAVGRYLDTLEPEVSVAVAGLSPDSMDRPTLAFTSQTSVQALRLSDIRETLIMPGGEQARILIPRVVPFDDQETMRRYLTTWADVEPYDSFISYHPHRTVVERHLGDLQRDARLPDGTKISLPASFDGRLTLVGYEWLRDEESKVMTLFTYWRVQDPPSVRLKIFLHLLRDGKLVAQDDGLASPPQGWMRDDLIIQKQVLPLASDPSPGLYTAEVGLYNALSLSRLSVKGEDRLLLSPVHVGAP